VVSVLVVAGIVTYASSLPEGAPYLAFFGMGCFLVPLAGLVGLAISVDYPARVVAMYYDRHRARRDHVGMSKGGRWRWLPAPLALLLVSSVILSGWPLRLRFQASRLALRQAADSYLAGTLPSKGPQVIGYYYVESVDHDDQGVIFTTGWDFDPVGFAYRPRDPWPNAPGRIVPCWYVEQW